jgi:hypothetical protein
MKSLKMKSLAIAFAAFAAGSANAGIVTEWYVDVAAAFLPGSIVDSNGSTPGGDTISNADHTLRWGDSTGAGQSGLDITPALANTVVTTGIGVVLPPVSNVTITHTNHPITGTSLDKVTLRSTLTLTPKTPSGPSSGPVSLDFLIDYLETDNGANPCANGGANGSGVNVNGCGDIFVIDKESLNFQFLWDDNLADSDPAQLYYISFVEVTSGLNPLPTAACLAATGSSAACLGFITPEDAVTPFTFGALITTEPVQITVPEPGILGLLGLGLAAMGFSLRRKA